MRRLPSLNALKAFEATARHCSFTLAAEELLVTQSAVSRQVRSLEDYLDAKLFLRNSKSMELTQQGKQLLPFLTDMFDRLAVLTADVQGSSARLRIKLPPTFAIRWLIPRLEQFELLHQDITVLVSTGWNPVNFDAEDFDAGIVCASDLGRYDSSVRQELIVQEQVTPVCSPALLKKGPPLKEPSDLFNYKLLHGTELFDVWKAWFSTLGITVPSDAKTQMFDLMDTAQQAALRGYGIAVATPQFLTEEISHHLITLPFPELSPALSGYFLVVPSRSNNNKAVEIFEQWLDKATTEEWGAIAEDHLLLDPNQNAEVKDILTQFGTAERH